MSHELILAAGEATDAIAQARQNAVEHAAEAVPGADQIEMHETPHTCVALIATHPPSGDVAKLTVRDGECRATVALTSSGLQAAENGTSHRVGSESGHVTVTITNGGAVEVTTDGFATVGTYWATHRGHLLVATNLASLVSLGLPGRIDEQGAIEYLAMLHPLQDRTILEGASLLQPGSTLSWEANRINLTRKPIFVPGPAHGDSPTTVREFDEIWSQVIGDAFERSRSARALIGLSGGLDSRIVAAQWVRAGGHPIAYTYGDVAAYEVRVASALASRLDIPHLRVPVSDDDLLAGSDVAIHLLDGAHAPTQMYELWFGDRLRSVADVIVNGLGGGTLMGDDKLMGLADIGTQVKRVWSRYESDVSEAAPFVSGRTRDDMAAIVRTSIARSFDPFSEIERADSGIYWRIANRQFRWGNMFHSALRRIGIRPETPFLDGRFLAYAARLTPEQRLNGVLYLSIQRSLFPETADLPRSDDGNSPAHLDHAYWSGERSFLAQLIELGTRHPLSAARRGYRRAADQAARRLSRLDALADLSHRVRARKDVFPADVFIRERPIYGLRLADALEAAKGTTPLLDDEVIDRAVQAVRARQPAHSASAMGRIAALGAWAREYRRRAEEYKMNVPSPSALP